MSDVPYRRNYGRLLIAAAVLATLAFPFIPKQADGAMAITGAFVGTFGVATALIWAPTLFYAGLRSGCRADTVAGVIGMLTLLYWIPTLIYA